MNADEKQTLLAALEDMVRLHDLEYVYPVAPHGIYVSAVVSRAKATLATASLLTVLNPSPQIVS